jgi:son of sevenless-like protein
MFSPLTSVTVAAPVAGHARDVIRDFSTFLTFVADICVARHVDIDGIQRQPGQKVAHDAYMKTVDNARSLVRLLEVSVQSIYDDSASLLLTMQALRQANQEQSDEDRVACFRLLFSLAITMEGNTKVVEQTLQSLLQVGLEQSNMAVGDYNGSIGWRMSRVSVIENTLRPLVTPNTARGVDDDSVVDMEHAFGQRGGTRPPPTGDRTGSDESQSGNEDLPPTPTWDSAGHSMDSLVSPGSPSSSAPQLEDEADLDDDDGTFRHPHLKFIRVELPAQT